MLFWLSGWGPEAGHQVPGSGSKQVDLGTQHGCGLLGFSDRQGCSSFQTPDQAFGRKLCFPIDALE